ncbi:DUF2087 domain-containing protein [Microtetraspora niveoalba]|uniref:DUF2087 domain-containing protein n=1 Tax=Microtetraspora niveoalba TaxID=46175 RepID=UPI000836C45F|nr:DUF2087 domain-containing protein [Microtetraspora niveoalba]
MHAERKGDEAPLDPAMTPKTLVGLLAQPSRMRVLAAIALGAATPAAVAEAAGVPAKEAARAVRRFQEHGLVVAGGQGLDVDYALLRDLSRRTAAESAAPGGEGGESGLWPFVQGDRLIKLPARQSRRRAVLEHVVARSFDPEAEYDERAVNERLRAWCEGGEADHAAVRRYLVDMGILARGNGVYRIKGETPPEPGIAERHVRSMGLE